MLKRKKFWIALILGTTSLGCLACLAVIFSSGLGKAANKMLTLNQQADIGRRAPDFEIATLNGETVKLSAWQGSPVVIIFSATWCPDCQREAPLLEKTHETYPGLKILWVDSGESDAEVRAFVDQYQLSMPVASDTPGTAADAYGIYAIPTVFFVDQAGTIQARLIESFSQAQIDGALGAIGVAPK